MQARRRQFLQQTVTVVVSARKWIVLSLPIIWAVTGGICHFSRPWLGAMTTGTAIVLLLMVLLLLNTHHRHLRALSRQLHHLERAITQRERHVERPIKKMHKGQHNGRNGDGGHDR
jgi:low affinity Fe/Cu permease